MANNRSVIQEAVDEPSVYGTSLLNVCSMEQEQGWQQPIVEYLITGNLPKHEKEAKAMK